MVINALLSREIQDLVGYIPGELVLTYFLYKSVLPNAYLKLPSRPHLSCVCELC